MDFIEARHSARQRAEALAHLIPDPWSIEEFLRRLSEQRGRPIRLGSFAAGGGDEPCGVYAATDTEDHILYPQQASPLQSEHVILHEVAHMLFDSRPQREPDERAPIDAEYARLLFPDIPVHLIREFLGRTGYSTEVERHAEGFADEFRHVIDRHRQRAAAGSMTPDQRAIAERLGAALRHRSGSDLG